MISILEEWHPLIPGGALSWIVVGWVLSFFSILALLNFHPVVKTEQIMTTPWPLVWIPFFLGLWSMVRGYRLLPKREARDLSRKSAWISLAIIFAAGAFLRLYQADRPPGMFWDDWATIVGWVHYVLDKNKVYWMFPSDGIEPFVPYVVTLIQAIVPDAVPDILVRRVAGCLIDLTALWVLYLCGKELGSRRLGLLAAGLGALGRPMIQLTVTGMRAFSLPLAVSLLILTSLKIFRKPSLGHFLGWGAALAFGVQTYTSFRTFMLIVPFLILPWAVLKKEKSASRTVDWAGWAAGLGSVFLLMGVYSGTFSKTDSLFLPWRTLWYGWMGNGETGALVFILGLAPAIYAVWKSYRKKQISRLAGWSLAVGLSCLIILPMTFSFQFNDRLSALTPFQDLKTLPKIMEFLAKQSWQTVKSLFYWCLDRNDLEIATDPFFDLFSQGALLLGLAYLIARPDWKKGFLLALGAVGSLVYVISYDPASTKLIASAPPLYLLGAWGISEIWRALPDISRKKKLSLAPVLLALFLGLYGCWGGWIQWGKIYGFWANKRNIDQVLFDWVGKDQSHNRVYLVPSDWFFGWNSQTVLEEGRRFYYLKDINSIPVSKGQAPEDSVLYVYGSNFKMIKTLHSRYPQAQWQKIFIFKQIGDDPNPELYMWRVLIPGSTMPFDPKDPLYCEVEEGPWLRRFYSDSFGWELGGIFREARVKRISDPIPAEWMNSGVFEKYNYARLVQTLGSFAAPRDGEYLWALKFPGPLWFQIDGQTVWKRDVPDSGPAIFFKTRLKKGTHSIDIRTQSTEIYRVPRIRWIGTWDGACHLL